MKIYYARKAYDTVEEVEAAAAEFMERLNNNPNDYCTIKLLTPNPEVEDGWFVPQEGLTDTEILNISSTGNEHYSMHCKKIGLSHHAVPASDVSRIMHEFKAAWISSMHATYATAYHVPNIDLSEYVDPPVTRQDE